MQKDIKYGRSAIEDLAMTIVLRENSTMSDGDAVLSTTLLEA